MTPLKESIYSPSLLCTNITRERKKKKKEKNLNGEIEGTQDQ